MSEMFSLIQRFVREKWLSKATEGSSEDVALAHLSQAYLTLLRMPHGGVRARNQRCLVDLCDAIATELGDDPEGIQNFYEYWAAHGGPMPRDTVPETGELSTPTTT